MPDKLTVAVQSLLDDLWAEELIPFQLTAHKVESLGREEYIIRFYDPRLHSLDVSWKEPDSFENAVRVAILARVARFSGSLKNRPKKGLGLDQRP
jgi:hypothetical protein